MSTERALATAQKILDSGEVLSATNEEIREMAKALVALHPAKLRSADAILPRAGSAA